MFIIVHDHCTLGRLQPCTSRMPAKPEVNFEKGGSDFRTPSNLSSFGRQILSYKHTNSSGTVVFSHDSRFKKAETIGPGPNLPQMSAMKKQVVSTRRSAESTNFGTSTRDGALKLYTVYTYKRW